MSEWVLYIIVSINFRSVAMHTERFSSQKICSEHAVILREKYEKSYLRVSITCIGPIDPSEGK